MSAINAMRHTAIHDPMAYADKTVALIGVGTIGSNLAHLLARMQVPMLLYDHDTVEEHNLATQTYGMADIGRSKAEVVTEQISLIHPDAKVSFFAEKYKPKEKADLIISAVDSLDARRSIANMLIKGKLMTPVIDGRVGAEQAEVYYFPSAKEWLEQLPEKGDTDPCGARFTAYTAYICAGLMANNVKRFLMGQKIQERIIYDAATSTFIKE